MLDRNELTKAIGNGVKSAYNENIHFTKNWTGLQNRIIESLVVVNIAQFLAKWDIDNCYCIQLEYPMRAFFNGAFPSMKFSKPQSLFENKMVFRSKNHSKRKSKSRIDIALVAEPVPNSGDIFHDPSWISLTGIEVKSINKPDKLIIKDIERLAKAMDLTDPIGDNLIEVCYSVFIRRLDNAKSITSTKEITKKSTSEKKKWECRLDELKSEYPSLDFKINEIELVNSVVENFVTPEGPDGVDAASVAEDTGFIICFLVEISRFPSNADVIVDAVELNQNGKNE
jgi:hypothetical protein